MCRTGGQVDDWADAHGGRERTAHTG
ncbi:hypothetical protein V3C99_003881, partial [Haemonchus contortus]